MKYLSVFKRDLYIIKRFTLKKILILYSLLILMFFMEVINEKDSEVIIGIFLNPTFDSYDFLRDNIYYLLLILGGYIIFINDFIRDLFMNNWMLLSRCKNKVLLYLSKVFASFIVIILLYQILFINMYILAKVFNVNNISIDIFIRIGFLLALASFSLIILGVLLSIIATVNIANIVALIVSLVSIYFKISFIPSGIGNLLVLKNTSVINIVAFFIILLLMIAIEAWLYLRQDLY